MRIVGGKKEQIGLSRGEKLHIDSATQITVWYPTSFGNTKTQI